jgi:hypothetical protein
MEASKVYYGLRLPDGSLARLNRRDTSDGYCCGSSAWTLVSAAEEPNGPIFLVDEARILSDALFEDTPWYNSEEVRPSWGRYGLKDLTPVRVVLTAEEVDIRPPASLPSVVDCRSLSPALVKLYCGVEDVPSGRWTGYLMSGPPEAYRHLVGKEVAVHSVHRRATVRFVGQVPDSFPLRDREVMEKVGSLVVCMEAP